MGHEMSAEPCDPEEHRIGDPALDAAIAEGRHRVGVSEHDVEQQTHQRHGAQHDREVPKRSGREREGRDRRRPASDEGQKGEQRVDVSVVPWEYPDPEDTQPEQPQQDRRQSRLNPR